MDIFLTGAAGYIGGSVAAGLLAAGHRVAGLVRSEAQAEAVRERGITPVVGTLDDAAILAEAARRADAVINAANADHEPAVRALTAALAGSGKPFLHTSGSSVVGTQAGGRKLDAIYDETTPFTPSPGRAARAALNAALLILGNDTRAPILRQQLAAMNTGVFLGAAIVPEDTAAPVVEIRPGDSFLKIGRRYDIPAGLLESLNPGVNSRSLRTGGGIKVVQGPFHLRYTKSGRRLDLYARDLYVKSYDAIVEEGDLLPRGTYRIKAATKITVGGTVWVGFEGVSAEARQITIGWIYGSSGPRLGRNRGLPSGLKVSDEDMRQLYNTVVESDSLLRVEP